MALQNDDRTTSKRRVDRRQGPEDQSHLVISASQWLLDREKTLTSRGLVGRWTQAQVSRMLRRVKS